MSLTIKELIEEIGKRMKDDSSWSKDDLDKFFSIAEERINKKLEQRIAREAVKKYIKQLKRKK